MLIAKRVVKIDLLEPVQNFIIVISPKLAYEFGLWQSKMGVLRGDIWFILIIGRYLARIIAYLQ